MIEPNLASLFAQKLASFSICCKVTFQFNNPFEKVNKDENLINCPLLAPNLSLNQFHKQLTYYNHFFLTFGRL